MNELTTAVQNQANDLHTAIGMVLDKSSELHKERQRAEQLYAMCENLWKTLSSIRVDYYYILSKQELEDISNVLFNNNPSKLKAND